jgi:hypothetical protein
MVCPSTSNLKKINRKFIRIIQASTLIMLLHLPIINHHFWCKHNRWSQILPRMTNIWILWSKSLQSTPNKEMPPILLTTNFSDKYCPTKETTLPRIYKLKTQRICAKNRTSQIFSLKVMTKETSSSIQLLEKTMASIPRHSSLLSKIEHSFRKDQDLILMKFQLISLNSKNLWNLSKEASRELTETNKVAIKCNRWATLFPNFSKIIRTPTPIWTQSWLNYFRTSKNHLFNTPKNLQKI